jgi:Arc/MetJ-type ribon-helix-helix transcriptional regulator
MEKKELTNLNIKVPRTLKELIAKYVKCDLHTNASDFTRDALREKLQRDAPELYKRLFQEAQAVE